MTRRTLTALEILDGRKPLSETELSYMRIIWNNPEGISSDDIYRQFASAAGTKSTILFRISEKGYVNLIRKGKHFLYTPKVTELQYNQALMQMKLKKTFGISQLPNFIVAFCGKQQPSDKELQRVQDFIKELENE